MTDRADFLIRRWDEREAETVHHLAHLRAVAASSPGEWVDPVTLLIHNEQCTLGDPDTICECPSGWPREVKR